MGQVVSWNLIVMNSALLAQSFIDLSIFEIFVLILKARNMYIFKFQANYDYIPIQY